MEKVKPKINPENVPFQVSSVIESLLHGKDKEHIKENYRIRLIDIRNACNEALDQYDEMLRTREITMVRKR